MPSGILSAKLVIILILTGEGTATFGIVEDLSFWANCFYMPIAVYCPCEPSTASLAVVALVSPKVDPKPKLGSKGFRTQSTSSPAGWWCCDVRCGR